MVIQRRRNRNPEEEAAYHDSTYSYRVRIKRDNKVVEIPVCYKAFLSILVFILVFLAKGKVEYLQKSLKETGLAPKDKRGKHCALTNKSEQQIRRLQTENELHKRKAQTFYDRKREAKKRGKTTTDFEAIAMDFQKNEPLQWTSKKTFICQIYQPMMSITLDSCPWLEDVRIQGKLLLEKDLKFSRACEIAQNMELTQKEAKQFNPEVKTHKMMERSQTIQPGSQNTQDDGTKG
ncbi:hypothetical protein QE152_g18933 [Popillia japonica]|uniref:Uncharacterized protein n=1 Tax=Popillia japonica TaxID=7064 RepID=A0AAW1L404_POPJA